MHDFGKNSILNQQLTQFESTAEQVAAIKQLWRIVAAGADSVFEIRALWPKGIPGAQPALTKHFRASDYDSLDGLKAAFEKEALALNAQGYNVYTVMNPIRADFAGPGAAKDADIRYRDLLLIDIDRVGDTSCPANQAELDGAKALAEKIRAHMLTKGWSKPVVVMSGNGYHLYYVLDGVPNEELTAALVRTTLKQLAAVFNTDVVGVDTSVYNASRITKVPGTIMRKGIASTDRPYRMAEVCNDD